MIGWLVLGGALAGYAGWQRWRYWREMRECELMAARWTAFENSYDARRECRADRENWPNEAGELEC